MGVASSLIGTVIVFIIAGRSLGPEAFGQFSIAYATASIFGIILDFGYTTRLLRDMDICEKSKKVKIRIETITIKASVLLITTLLIFVTIHKMNLNQEIAARLWLGIALISISNLFSTTLKSIGLHLIDSRNTLAANLSSIILAIYFYKINATAAQFTFVIVLSGALQLIFTIRTWLKHGTLSFTPLKLSSLKSEVSKNFSYLLDAVSQRGFGFIDVMILGAVAPTATVGIYQAAQKIAQFANIFAQPFSNVFVPKLSRVSHLKQNFLHISFQAVKIQFSVGIIAFIGLLSLGPMLVKFLYSGEYSNSMDLMWLFGILVCIRYFAASQTLQITALGLQRVRTVINLICLAFFAILAYPFSLIWGSHGIILASIIASTLIGILAFVLKERHLLKLT